jgi:hypothetical protein
MADHGMVLRINAQWLTRFFPPESAVRLAARRFFFGTPTASANHKSIGGHPI